MNRVIRSPDISQTPVVISAKRAAGTALLTGADGSETFEEVGPQIGGEDGETGGSLAEDAEESTETEAAGEPPEGLIESASGEEQADAPSAGETPQRSPEFGPVPPVGDEDIPGPQAAPPSEPASQGPTLSEEEGEIMIGMEEIAERDAAAGAMTTEPPPSTEEPETADPLPASASEIESIVEERLKEFEERFQQEKEDAYHAGFEDGTNEGMKQGLTQSEEEIERFQSTVDTLTGQWKDTLKTYDTAVTDLAIRVAQKIISVEIEKDHDAVLQAVHDCLAYVEDKTKVTIRVNPDDLEAVRRHRNDWLESLESIDHLLIESEPSVSRGGCIVETPIGDVDAQIEERLERLRSVLLEEINKTDTGQES